MASARPNGGGVAHPMGGCNRTGSRALNKLWTQRSEAATGDGDEGTGAASRGD